VLHAQRKKPCVQHAKEQCSGSQDPFQTADGKPCRYPAVNRPSKMEDQHGQGKEMVQRHKPYVVLEILFAHGFSLLQICMPKTVDSGRRCRTFYFASSAPTAGVHRFWHAYLQERKAMS